MEQKQRPLSSKPISTLPIFIDEGDIHSVENFKPVSQLINKSKPKLSQLVPELPQFGIKNNSTALLYSKFIVKGLKQDKLSVVRGAYKKKQEITEACTIYRNIANKSIKTTTDLKTIQNNNNNVQIQDQSHTESNIVLQTNNLVRASSAKVFKKTLNRQIADDFDNKLIKNNTQANLHSSRMKKRPTTAKLSHKNEYRFSQGPINDQNKFQFTRNRPTTADYGRQSPIISVKGATMPIKDLYEPGQISQIIATKLKDKPVKIELQKGTNYIERNIQNISTYSRKSSIYLTNANVQNLISNRLPSQASKKTDQIKTKIKQNTNECIPEQQIQLRPQQIFKKPDIQKHEKQMKSIQSYLVESAPSKFQIVSQQIRKQQKRNHTDQNYQQLLSMDLDNGFEDNKQQINEKSAKACFQDYILNCQVLQYNIASKLKNQQVNKVDRTALDIYECQQILNIYKELKKQPDFDKKKQYINKIRQITKNLKYFSHKPKQQIDKLFTIPFQIVIAEQGEVVIQSYSLVNDIYIILNGSVLVESFTNLQLQKHIGLSQAQPLHSKISIFDGQLFGETSRPSQKSNKNKITTLQQSLLFKIKHEDYISVFFEGSEVQEKIQALKLAFKAEINSGVIKEDDLQILSMSLQKHTFPSKSLVFRQGQVFDKLIIVRKGKLLGINQYILNQNKVKNLDMKQVDKYVRESAHQTLSQLSAVQSSQTKFIKVVKKQRNANDTLKLQDLRRQNLINYEILKQDNNRVYYYFMKQQAQFIKGDTINWRPILNMFTSHLTNNALEQSMQAIFLLGLTSSLKPATYSLMSNSDETEVYFLSRNSFQYLPNDLKSALYAKARDKSTLQLKGEPQTQINKWNAYKQKLCNQIVKQRKQRSCKRL